MKPPARGAAVRGDDYQYAVAWVMACRALNDAAIASVSIEDAGAGQFDDVAVRRADDRPDHYFQVKSSNAGNIAINEEWLTTAATEKGQSPLQHFHRTWKKLTELERPFQLTLLTSCAFDNGQALIGPARDNFDCHIRVHEVRYATPGSDLGKARDTWAKHLQIEVHELLELLGVVRWEQAGAEASLRETAKPLIELAGLRDVLAAAGRTVAGYEPRDERVMLLEYQDYCLAPWFCEAPTHGRSPTFTATRLSQVPSSSLIVALRLRRERWQPPGSSPVHWSADSTRLARRTPRRRPTSASEKAR